MDLNKAIRQHLELDGFFTGFVVIHPGKLFTGTPDGPMSEEEGVDQSLEAIIEQIHDCRRCDLSSGRNQAVPGEGHPQARIMFVGEAPGTDEDAQGRPFVGVAGQFLDKIITACGLLRQDVFIANVLKCHPPYDRDPRPEEIVACMPFLIKQIEQIRPLIIVALGAHAARTLLNINAPIGQLRGHFHEYPLTDGTIVKVMPTFHPAYLLRNPTSENRRKVWEDMKTVLTELGLPIPNNTTGR